MFNKDKGLYLVYYNGFYVCSDYLPIGQININIDIEKAKIFNSLNHALKVARKLQGEVLIYSHDSTTSIYEDITFNTKVTEDVIK